MEARGNVIMLFVKAPVAGLVKTRIAATLGDGVALDLYREMAERICRQLPPDVPVVVHFTPSTAEGMVKSWLAPLLPNACAWISQRGGDLGERLHCAFQNAFSCGWQRVVVIGTDCIEITPEILKLTWRGLSSPETCVIGPARDGGYYLLGLGSMEPRVFAGIPWSTAATCTRTIAAAEACRLKVTILPVLNDIDTVQDLPESFGSRTKS